MQLALLLMEFGFPMKVKKLSEPPFLASMAERSI
jgi:hypothetical protein